ncbi:MAG: hypothetical protein KAU24_03370, partial [Candidatus Aenigmarchaeota archaeon]|nr:hypothetical protein [Candidatus Aenigmarchaeota archaeon]
DNLTGPFITYDPINITYIAGNGSFINRDDDMGINTTATLIVYVNDTLKNESVVPGTEVTFWITYNGSEWDIGNATQTNATGYAIDVFNPGCSHPIFTYYRVGNQDWIAGVTDSCYENINLSVNYSLNIKGTLHNEIDLPPLGTTYERVNENISVRGVVRDDCLNTLLEANVTFNFTHEGGTEYDCWPTTNITIYYECTRNTTGMFARWYNTTMYANYTDHYDNITTKGDHFFIKTKPFLYNATALIDPGGWGERFYFFVNITDEDLDNVTVNLYTKKYGAASWGSPKNSTWIEAPVNESVVLSWRDDTCDNIDTWEFYFEGTDNRSLSNVSKTYNFTVEKDEVNFTMMFGHNEDVWRNGTDNLTFVVYLYDTDRDTIVASGSNTSFWVTMNASDPNSWDSGFTTYVNATSYINYEFPTYVPEPTECNYTVGVQEWKAGTGGVNEDKCYMSMNSTEFNITIRANLIPQIISPNGEGFLWGTPIPIVGFMEDDCYSVEDIEVRWRFEHPPDVFYRYQDPANQSSGWYNYTLAGSDTQRSPGYYDIQMQANYNNQNPYYGLNSTNKPDAFFIALAPVITDHSIDKTLAGWGEENKFSVRINDPDLNYNNITLWKRLWNVSAKIWENWTLVDNKSIDQLTNVWVDFFERFTCSDMGLNEYRFDTKDEFNFSDSTYNDLTNVSGKLIHNASDNVLENISKTIHTATEDSGFNYSEQINTSGAMEYFNITIENTGNQTFYFNLTVNGVQIAENQSIANGTNETTDAVTGGSTFALPDNQTINLTVMNESGSPMNANYTEYLAYVVLDSGFDYNEDISDSGGVSFFNVTIENLDTQTFYFNLTVNGYQVAENESIASGTNGTIDAWAEGASFTLLGNQTINLTIMDIYGNETGAKYRSYLSYTSGILLFKLEPDNVTLEVCKPGQCSPYSNTTVRRLGDTTAYLNFRIYDEDYSLYPNGTSGRVWVTEDHSNYTVVLDCNSENSGYCHVDYNATCSSDVGVQYWISGTYDSCYEPVNTSVENLNVIGQLYARTIQPDENDVLNRNVSEILNVTIVDECDNYISDTDVSWYNETPLLIANASGSSFTYYNSTWYILEDYVLGPEIIYTNSTRTNYDMGSNTTHVYIYGWASIDNIDPDNYTEYPAGAIVNVTCHVIDINTGQPIQDYNVTYYKNESWQNFSLTNQYGNATWEWNTTNDTAGWYDIKCNISDDTVKYYNTSVSYMSTLIKVRRQLIIDQINASEPIVYRNDSYYPYETVISVHVNDASIGNANASNVTFWNTSMMIGYCMTNESGNCNITWNPYNKSAADNHTIYINATKGGLEDSATEQTYIEIWGVLILNITSPINESNYTKTDNITLDVNITNELGEDITDANVSWWNETSFLVSGDHYENFSLTGQSPGNRTITSNATKTYYLSGNDTVKILISGVADVLWDSPA